jgi:hypothetical protein
MTNPFNQAHGFFSEAYAMQEQAAQDQTRNQRQVDSPQRHDYFPTRKEAYNPNSPAHNSQSFMEDLKRGLLEHAARKRVAGNHMEFKAGGGVPVESVLPS